MLEVRPGLLLGSMGDALAVFTRLPSVVAQYHVTHVLSLCNEPPEWMEEVPSEEEGGSGSEVLEGVEEVENEKENGSLTREHAVQEEEEDEKAKSGGRRRRRRRGKGQVELPKWRKFIAVADMPKSDLLHHFDECCQFIRDGRERGTVLVHCEHGVSRSVTVVLAYLMWSEQRSLKLTYRELKQRKPEIRPNSGFMDQLRLWGEMGCQLKQENKKYKAYRLQCKAREIEVAGCVEKVEMAPDPATSPTDAAIFFRCRKCRQLLFTDRDVLQHELGEGRGSFHRHRGKRGGRAWQGHSGESVVVQSRKQLALEEEGDPREVIEGKGEGEGGQGVETELVGSEGESVTRGKREGDGVCEEVVLGGNTELPVSLSNSPWDHTPSPLAEVATATRNEVAQLAFSSPVLSPSCTSYFIEPVAWMGDALLSHVEGKILCPKCNSRLGSFSWKGQQCSCGRWLTPAFRVHKSKVDDVRTLSRRKIK